MGEHPSAFELESWLVDERTEEVSAHIKNCKECRNAVDRLELSRQEFLDEEDVETFLNRPSIAKVIEKQISMNKQKRKQEARRELSEALPFLPEKTELKPTHFAEAEETSWNYGLIFTCLIILVAILVFIFS